jgi:hypothetical protein
MRLGGIDVEICARLALANKKCSVIDKESLGFAIELAVHSCEWPSPRSGGNGLK